jgi:hypothetical protein
MSCIYCENLEKFGLLPREEYQFHARQAYVFDPKKNVSEWTYAPPETRFIHRDKWLAPLHAGVLCQEQTGDNPFK